MSKIQLFNYIWFSPFLHLNTAHNPPQEFNNILYAKLTTLLEIHGIKNG